MNLQKCFCIYIELGVHNALKVEQVRWLLGACVSWVLRCGPRSGKRSAAYACDTSQNASWCCQEQVCQCVLVPVLPVKYDCSVLHYVSCMPSETEKKARPNETLALFLRWIVVTREVKKGKNV
jgi:hypothetical protein